MNIIIGCDQNGLQLKRVVKEHIEGQGHTVDDVGVFGDEPVMYPDIALRVAEDIAEGKHGRGILICGTGIGMVMVANKVPGVRAAQAHDVYSAERARKSNDAQILTFGAQIIGVELAKKIVDAWLASEFAGGRSAPKVAKINAIDERFRRRD